MFNDKYLIYYYNAFQGKSLWSPPLDAIVHEAINARPPTYIELAGGSSSYGKNNEILVGPKVKFLISNKVSYNKQMKISINRLTHLSSFSC